MIKLRGARGLKDCISCRPKEILLTATSSKGGASLLQGTAECGCLPKSMQNAISLQNSKR